MPNPTGAKEEAAHSPCPQPMPSRCLSQAVPGLFGAPSLPHGGQQAPHSRQGCPHHVTQRTWEGQYLGGSWACSGVKDPQFLVLLR